MSQPLGTLGMRLPAPIRLPQLSPPLWMAALLLVAAAALLPGLWTAAGLAALVMGGLVLLRPEVAVYLLALSIPLGSLAVPDREEISFAVTPTEVITGLLVAGWVLRSLTRRRFILPGTPLWVPLLAMLAIVTASAFQATSLTLSLKEGIKWLELVLVYAFVATEMGGYRQVLGVVMMLLAGAAIEALLGAGQFVLGIGPEFFAIGRFMRAYGTFEQPNPYAGYLGMLIPLAAGLLLGRPSPRVRAWGAVAAVLAVAAVGMSLSRGAWLGIAVAFVLMALFWSRRSRLLLAAGVLAASPAAALAFMNLLPSELSARLATVLDYFRFIDVTREEITVQNWAVIERVAHWQAALDMIEAHPLFGVGAGNYPAVYQWYAVQGWPEALGHAHNFYLNIAAETGIPGLLIYLSFTLAALASTMVWLGRSRYRSRPPSLFWRGILLGVLGALVASSIHNLFDSLFVHSMNVQLGMILGLGQLSAVALFGERPDSAAPGAGPGRSTVDTSLLDPRVS